MRRLPYHTDKRDYAEGTYILSRQPWGIFVGGAAICPDGRLRAVKLAACADSFFTIPASVKVRGKTVSGFVTFASDSGLSTDPQQWLEFHANASGRNAEVFATATTEK